MVDDTDDPTDLPAAASGVAEAYPDVWDAYADLGEACSEAGPIDGETKRLVKLALAVGAQSEGAVHSHVRRGLEEDVDPEALRHVAMLATPTIGFPKSVAALTWIDDLAD
jgi:alkylhydroperoxidase/carboxymuconolactone decarboxylase family protein YurZ